MPGLTNESHCSAIPHAPETDKFQALVEALSQKLGPSSGIDSEDVDARELQELMDNYTSNESEWTKYAFADYSRSYTRNLVDKGNGKSNLVCRPIEFLISFPIDMVAVDLGVDSG